MSCHLGEIIRILHSLMGEQVNFNKSFDHPRNKKMTGP